MKTYSSLGLALAAISLAACGGDDGGGGDADSGTPPETVEIQDVQNDAMAIGTQVTIADVVVTAIDNFGDRKGAIYVEEPEGGAFSGVVVNTSAVPSGVEVGSVVTVTGFKDEFALSADTTGRTITQIGSPAVTVTGTGTVPAPEVLDPRTLANDEIEAEKWEGVLVTFENVAFEGLPRGVTETDPELLEARVTGPFRVQSALVAFPEGIAYRDCYVSVTGIGDYFFDYKILPRTAADFVAGGSSCPAEEALCANGEDDDADGYADCEDFACFDADKDLETNVCATEATTVEAQNGVDVAVDAVVEINAIVTAVGRDSDEVWIKDLGNNDDHNGLHVQAFRSVLPGGELPSAVTTIGQDVTVIGVLRDSFGETVLSNASITDGPEDPVVPVANTGVDLALLSVKGGASNLTTGAVYEGQLVNLGGLEVVAIGQFGQFTLSDGANEIIVDDSLFSYTAPTVGQCTSADTLGIIMLNTFDDFYYLAPRDAGDIVFGSCS